jgi:hypothetical protein
MLSIAHSGTAGNPITFSSYPADCEDQPILSGAQPISGWTAHSTNAYVANLGAGQNAGKFDQLCLVHHHAQCGAG